MSVQINQIYNASVYVDGNSLLGKAKEIKLPDIEHEFIEHKSLGLHGTLKLPAGMNALEGEITWASFYPEVRAKVYNPFETMQLQIRSNLQSFSSNGLNEQKALVTFMNVAFSKLTGGSFKNNENPEFADTFQIYSIKQIIEGKEILFIDVMANIYRVDGVDVLAKFRANI